MYGRNEVGAEQLEASPIGVGTRDQWSNDRGKLNAKDLDTDVRPLL